MKKFYITTPIYYPSGRLHLGHAYTTIAGDVLKRFKEQQGYSVFYLTGTDEHGEKIAKKAVEQDKTPQQFVDDFSTEIKELWKLLHIDYDKFIRTTDNSHISQVQYIFTKMLDAGHIYLGEYKGQYCVSCESYFTETQLNDGRCPDCGGPVEELIEESYFFKTSNFVDRLLQHYDENPDFILPISRKNELINSFIKPGLPDLAISRSNFDWGIKIPNDEDKVIYVWLDALTNYITALDYQNDGELFEQYWPADVQLMGKEIIRFHAIYWPMFLMALELPLPKRLFAHGWLLMDSDKMSKSKGNVIYSEFLVENYGVDTLRYYLLREIPFGDDGYFSPENYIARINNDIVNDYGNLVNRTISMANKYFKGKVRNNSQIVDDLISDNHINFEKIYSQYLENMERLHFSKALEDISVYVSATNKFVDLTKPWQLAKEGKEEELNAVLYVLLESVRKITILLKPVFVTYSSRVFSYIGYDGMQDFTALELVVDEYNVIENPTLLLERLDVEVEVAKIYAEMAKYLPKESIEKEQSDLIEIDDFNKVSLVVGKVLSVKKHDNAKKLLVLQIDLGDSSPRQIVSGLAQYYNPEQLENKNLVVVENLKPVNLRGVESNGMVLTTENDEDISVVEINSEVKPGTRLS